MDRRQALKLLSQSLGITIATPTLLSALVACQSKSAGEFQEKGQFLSQAEALFVTNLSECILPKTDTPGASELNLIHFIDRMLVHTLSASEQNAYRRGLQLLRNDLLVDNHQSYHAMLSRYFDLSLERQQQVVALQALSAEQVSAKDRAKYQRYHCLLTTRKLALLGFYGHETICKQVLSYDPLPGVYLPCVPLEDIGNAWSE